MTEVVLGIDTSTRVAVGLARDEQVLVSRLVGDTRSHVELLAGTIRDALAEAGLAWNDVTHLAVGVGPGPFTGLRVGIATAQTLGLALGLPVTGVCSLDVVALRRADETAGRDGEFLAVLDARRHEVYWAHYDGSGLRLAGPFVGPPAELPDLPVVGPGVAAHPELVVARGEVVDDCPLDAGLLAASLDRLPDVGLEPLYLRPPDAALPTGRKSAIAGGRLRLPLDNLGAVR